MNFKISFLNFEENFKTLNIFCRKKMLSRIVSSIVSSQSKAVTIQKCLNTNILQTVQSRHYRNQDICIKQIALDQGFYIKDELSRNILKMKAD